MSDPYEETPQARAALQDAFDVFSKDYDDGFCLIENADNAFAKLLATDDGLSERQKFIICCSAMNAKMAYVDDISEVHPFSEAGFGLADVIKAFVWKAIIEAEEKLEIDLPEPEWIKRSQPSQ